MTVINTRTVAVVVNDDMVQLTILTELLRMEGLEVHPFQSAETALIAMESLPTPDLIVTDLYMPGIDGWRFCQLLRSSEYSAFNQTPILVISATYAGTEAARITADLGANAFLPSPVGGDSFRATVRALLTGQKLHQPLRLLIVDDSASLVGVLQKAFAEQGYFTDIALNVAEALEAFASAAYDLAVLDYHLPDGDGGMLLDAFRQQRPACACLVMTAQSSPRLALDLLKRGAAAFVNKPFDPEYLLEISARALRERSLLRVQDLLEERTLKLRDSERRFRSMTRNAFDLVALLDKQGHYLFCNDSYLNTFGYTFDELAGKVCFDRIHPDQRKMARELATKSLAEHRKSGSVQLDIRHHDGHYLQIQYHARLLTDSQGNSQVLLNGRDITHQLQAERELQRRDALLEATAEIGRILLHEKNLDTALQRAIDVAGIASNQDRAYLFTVTDDTHTGAISASIRYEWVRQGIPPEIDNPSLQDIPFSEQASSTCTRLHAGQIVSEHVCNMPAEEQEFLSAQDIQSLLLVPIEVYDTFWGFIGFDNCTTPYCWSAGEHSVLLSLAAAIGGAVTRQQTEQFVCENEERLRTLINATPDIILFKDGQGRWLEVNEATLELFCLTGVEYRGKTQAELADYTAPIYRQALLSSDATDARAWQRRELLIEEEAIQRVDGTIKIYETFKMPIFTATGERKALVVLGRDVTERKRVEKELRASKDEYQRLFSLTRLMADTMPDMLWAKDTERNYIFANKAVCQHLLNAQDTAEPIGRTDHFFAERERRKYPDNPTWHTFGELCMDSDAITLRELGKKQFDEFGHVKGQFLYLDVHKAPLFNAEGTLIGVVGSARDITERKQAEREREHLIRAIEQAGETIVITDVQGGIQYANPAFERSTGYTREEAMGINPRLLKSGVHDEAFYRQMWETLARGEAWTGRIVNRRKDGSLFTEDAIISPVRNSGGTTVSYVAVKRDVTEAIKLEEQLRQAQKMESIGRLAGGVAHDFNNMLGVILGRAEMCLEELLPGDRLRKFLEDIHQAASRSADLTRQLLAFARKQSITPRVTELNATVGNMLKMLQRLIGEDITLSWMPGTEVWPVCIDPSQIDQILANLCVNARDAIASVGTITITTENHSLDGSEIAGATSKDYVRLSVTDNGCGMDQETMALIFEPFFTTKEVGKGTGLGLSTIYGIVQQNNGVVDVQSVLGQGTTFSIYFPRHHAGTDLLANADPLAKVNQGRETILLVEDEPLLLEMTTDMLSRQGYIVLVATGPREAIRIASTHAGPLHLLLTDVIMPEINGLELATELESMHSGLKWLFMSGYTADVIAHHGIVTKGVQFIQKPFLMKELADKIREVLEAAP